MPTISVITPAKNRISLLRECMASVSAQTFLDWEHIIVDDGSSDGTAEMVTQLASSDHRFRYIVRNEGNSGANACRNIGIRESKSELLVFLDSDDLLDRTCLAERTAVMQRNSSLEFVVWKTNVFTERPGDLDREFAADQSGDDLLKFLLMEFPWQTTSPTWRKAQIVKLGGWDESLPSWQDVDIHIRAICAGMRYLKIPEVDHHVRWQFEANKVSVLQRRSPEHLRAADGMLVKFEETVRRGPGLDWCRQRALCGLYFFIAERWLDIGSRSNALESWKTVSRRKLCKPTVYWFGKLFLLCGAWPPARRWTSRFLHKWKGFVRFRINPELIENRN